MRRSLVFLGALVAALAATAGVASACGGLVAPNGTVRLVRTSTLAAYVDGVEHYVTSFQFAGGGAEVGSIVPLPGIPTKVERGGDWTLQRLARETQPPPPAFALEARSASTLDDARVVLETRIDALDLTVLEGGGAAVGRWALEHGFRLSPDAPEVLDFYARKSPVFLAARFDARAARDRGQEVGDGTPVHVTIPTDRPWVPLRILSLGRGSAETVQADVYLLTEERPSLLTGDAVDTVSSDEASESLLSDLRSDKGMEWVPNRMWLTYLRVDGPARELDHDLAIDPSGRRPSLFDFDRTVDAAVASHERGTPREGGSRGARWAFAIAGAAVAGAVALATRRP